MGDAKVNPNSETTVDAESPDGTEFWVLTCAGLPMSATTARPAHQIPDDDDPYGTGHWVLTRHADVSAALADPRLSITNSYAADADSPAYEGFRFRDTLLDLEPPDHTRLHKLAVRTFSAKEVEALRPRVQQITDEVLDGAESRRADIVETVAFELPIRLLCEVIGVPGDACEMFLRESDTSAFPPNIPMGLVYRTLAELIEDRRARPTGDLLSELAAANEDGRLSDDELLNFGGLLIFATAKASIHLIRNGLHMVACHLDQFDELRGDPTLLPSAIDEMIRHVGPSAVVARYALDDIEIGGVTIPKGSRVTLGLSAANHDPNAFTAPDDFDIHRGDGTGLAFGGGFHVCLGARLAKVQTEIVVGTLLRRFPEVIRDWSAATTQIRPDQVVWMDQAARSDGEEAAENSPCAGRENLT